MKAKTLVWTVHFSMVAILTTFTGSQIILSFVDLLASGSNLITLTFVEPDNNLQIRTHPYYTVCPIFYDSANVSDPGVTLLSAYMDNTRAFPKALYLDLVNSQALNARQFSTWVKMMDAYKDRGATLVHCTTTKIANNISLGQNEAKVYSYMYVFLLQICIPITYIDKSDAVWPGPEQFRPIRVQSERVSRLHPRGAWIH